MTTAASRSVLEADEDACLEHLWRQRLSVDGENALCPRCGQLRRFRRIPTRRSYRCTACNVDVHPTAGTIFHRSTTPLHVWFRAIRMLADDGAHLPLVRLESELGITYKTARRICDLVATAPPSLIEGICEAQAGSARVRRRTPAVVLPLRLRTEVRRHHSDAVWLDGDICTVAGDGTAGYGGDGGHAATAQLDTPYGIAIDPAGNVFISDEHNHAIRMIDRSGTISTVAGTGLPGWSGDGGPAISAQLRAPQALAFDGGGNLYVADTENHVVRRIDPSGRIETVAGTGAPGFCGDGGPAVEARFNGPSGMLVFDGSLYVADYFNHRVRRIEADGRVTTFAGSGDDVASGDWGPAIAAGLPRPTGLAADGDGNVYVSQVSHLASGAHRVRRIARSGVITPFAGAGRAGSHGDGGPAIGALLTTPMGLLYDASGRALLVCEYGGHRIRQVDASGVISTVVGTGRAGYAGNGGPGAAAQLAHPTTMARTATGDLVIVDSLNHRVRRVVSFFGRAPARGWPDQPGRPSHA